MTKPDRQECRTCKNPYCSRTLEERQKKEDEIGSSAGILMGIKASDFIELLGEIK